MPGSSHSGRKRQSATATGITTNEHRHHETLFQLLHEAREQAEQQHYEEKCCEAQTENMAEELQCQSEEIDKLRADLKKAEDLLQEGNELFDHEYLKQHAFWHDLAERNAVEAHSWKATANELRQELVDAQKEAQAWKEEEMRVSQQLIDYKMESVHAEWARLESKWSEE